MPDSCEIHTCADTGGVGSMNPLLLACEGKHKEVAQYLANKVEAYYVGKFMSVLSDSTLAK